MNIPSVSVIIVTLNRPECMRRCLRQLSQQTRAPAEVIVVDASTNTLTRQVVGEFPGVMYLRNDAGVGRMTRSRNIGIEVATGDVVAFIDDDAFPHLDWLDHLSATYAAPTATNVACVGGRVFNGEGVASEAGAIANPNQIGRLMPNGVLLGNFDADPGSTIDVDHVIGCNMSYRKEVLAELGGFREDYPGISGLREDSDMCLRVKRTGHRILFNPLAKVDHIGGTQVTGKRFDYTYAYYIQRNHLSLLTRNFGPFSAYVWRYLGFSFMNSSIECCRRMAGALMRLFIAYAATIWGAIVGIIMVIREGRSPIRIVKGDPIELSAPANPVRAAPSSGASA